MKYNLTSDQYYKLWLDETSDIENTGREEYIKSKFNLIYTEFEGFWGSVTGNEQEINWFLLHI